METRSLTFTLLPGDYAFCRLDPAAPIPAWATDGPFFSVTRTADELSIFCREAGVPADAKVSRGWRCLKVEGPFDFSAVGVIASFAGPLAEAGLSISVVSTYDTDYLFMQKPALDQALSLLHSLGHAVLA